jgi:hypothetical protein
MNNIVTKINKKFPENSKQTTEITNKTFSILPYKREIRKSRKARKLSKGTAQY